MPNSLNSPVILTKEHDVSQFDCGKPALNNYLLKNALDNTLNNSSKCYVTTRGNKIVGYYCLSVCSVEKASTPVRIGRGLGGYPVPLILITRLAVDLMEQNKGIGYSLLMHALLMSIQVSTKVGVRGIIVHAKDEQAKEFYLKYGFEPSPVDSLHLYMLIKDIKKTLDLD